MDICSDPTEAKRRTTGPFSRRLSSSQRDKNSKETLYGLSKELHSNVELFFRALESAKIGHLLVFMGFPGRFEGSKKVADGDSKWVLLAMKKDIKTF